MLDRNEAHDDRNGQNLPNREVAADRPLADRPVADREVPLPGLSAADDPSMVAIHQWLDGDLAETEARRSDDKQVEMWKRIAEETEQRRRMVTPAYVAANIMNALPEKHTAPRTTHAESQVLREDAHQGISLAKVVAIGAAMLVVGFALGRVIG
jgi:hypothetical protein